MFPAYPHENVTSPQHPPPSTDCDQQVYSGIVLYKLSMCPFRFMTMAPHFACFKSLGLVPPSLTHCGQPAMPGLLSYPATNVTLPTIANLITALQSHQLISSI